MKGMTGGILAFVVLGILIAYVAVPTILAVNTTGTGWTVSAAAIWAIAPLALALVVLIAAFRMTGA